MILQQYQAWRGPPPCQGTPKASCQGWLKGSIGLFHASFHNCQNYMCEMATKASNGKSTAN